MDFLKKLLGAAGNIASNEVYNAKRVAAQVNPRDGGLTFKKPYYESPAVKFRPEPPSIMPGGVPTVVNPNQFQQDGVVYRNPDNSPLTVDGQYPILDRPNNGNLSATDYYQAVPLQQPNFKQFKKLTRL